MLYVNDIPDGSPMELLGHVRDQVNAFVGDVPRFDDLTMPAVKLL